METGRLRTVGWVFWWSIAWSGSKVWAALRMLVLTVVDIAIHCLEVRELSIVGRPIWSRDAAGATVGRIGTVNRLLAAGWCVMMWGVGMLIGNVLRGWSMFMAFVW